LKVSPGDRFVFSSYPTEENGEPATLPFNLAALSDTIPLGAYQPNLGTLLVVSDAVFDRASALLRLESKDMAPGDLFFKTSDVVTFTRELKQRYQVLVGDELFYASPYESNQREQLTETVINLFFYGFLTLITLVGITNIVNTIDTNLHLRRREFAMLKSVGLTPQGFRKVLNYESLFYSLTALFFGLPAAIALSIILFRQYTGITSFEFTLPWRSMIICSAGVLLIVFTTMTASGARLGDDNIVDAIKEENL